MFWGLRNPIISSLFPVFSLVSSSFFSAVAFYHFFYIYSLRREQIICFLLATTSSDLDYHDLQFFAINNPILSDFCHKSCFLDL